MWRVGPSLFKHVHVSPVNNQQGVKERSCIIGVETQTWDSPFSVHSCLSLGSRSLCFPVTYSCENLGACREVGNIQPVTHMDLTLSLFVV